MKTLGFFRQRSTHASVWLSSFASEAETRLVRTALALQTSVRVPGQALALSSRNSKGSIWGGKCHLYPRVSFKTTLVPFFQVARALPSGIACLETEERMRTASLSFSA